MCTMNNDRGIASKLLLLFFVECEKNEKLEKYTTLCVFLFLSLVLYYLTTYIYVQEKTFLTD